MQQENNEEFERYRRQMHGNDDDNNRRQGSGRIVRWVYTILWYSSILVWAYCCCSTSLNGRRNTPGRVIL